jgi:hypothetical protein
MGGLSYDGVHAQVVLFGGEISALQFQPIGDTWVWDGANWTQKFPVSSPSPRSRHSMAYDASRSQVVLFGGMDQQSTNYQDTWVWDGSNWTQKAVGSGIGCCNNGMAFDSGRGQLVLWDINRTWVWPQP